MIRIAMVEDETAAMESIQTYLDKFSKEKGLNCQLVWFDNPVDFLSKYDKDFDLVLMDIKLPDMNGMEAARKLREMDDSVALIFVTNMAQFAIKGYEVDAVDFIVKPVTYYDFALKFARVVKKIDASDEMKISVVNKGSAKYIAAKDVCFVEVIKHKLLYHTADGVYEVRGTLKKAEETLISNGFAKCNNYCLVNLRCVLGVKGYVLTVSTGHGAKEREEIMISHPRKKAFVTALNEFLRENV